MKELGPHEEALTPSTARENLIAGTLFVLAILFGVLPHQTVLRYMERSIEQQVNELADWAERYETAQRDAAAEASAGELPCAADTRGQPGGGDTGAAPARVRLPAN